MSTVRKSTVVFCCQKRNGFTLISLLIALAAVIAIGTSVIFVGKNVLDNGRYNAARANVASISMAVSQYKFDMETYPQSLQALTVQVGQYGPWLSNDDLTDPWNNNYQYTFNEATNTFAVWSYGPDGANASGNNPTEFAGDDIGIVGH